VRFERWRPEVGCMEAEQVGGCNDDCVLVAYIRGSASFPQLESAHLCGAEWCTRW
jgi:hypothetical protein